MKWSLVATASLISLSSIGCAAWTRHADEKRVRARETLVVITRLYRTAYESVQADMTAAEDALWIDGFDQAVRCDYAIDSHFVTEFPACMVVFGEIVTKAIKTTGNREGFARSAILAAEQLARGLAGVVQ